jgi:TP901 family phage tail tape measure protein
MAISNDQLKFTLEVNSEAAKKAIEAMVGSTQKLNQEVKKTSDSFIKFDGSLQGIGASAIALNQAWELTTRVFMRVEAVIRGTVGAFADLETQVAKIRTITTEAEAAQTNFGEAILATKRQFGGDIANIGGAFYEAIASGATDAAGAVTLVNNANQLAVGGVTDLHTALSALTGIMMAYGYSAEETGRINDILFVGAREGKTSIQELAQEMGPVLAIAKQMNVGLDELVAAISTVSSSVGTTAEAVTSVRSALVALARQTDPLTALFKKLGINSIQAQIAQKGFVETLRLISKESGGTSESVLKLMERIEALATFATVTNETTGKRFDDIMKDMGESAQNAGEITTRAVGIMAGTINVQLAQMRANADEIFTRLGAVLQAAFGPIVSVLTPIITGTATLFRNMADQVVSSSKEIWAALAAVAATAGLMWLALTSMTGIQIVVAGFTLLADVLTVVITKMGLVIGITAKMVIPFIAVAGVIDYFIQNITNMGDAIARMMTRILRNIMATIEGIVGAVQYMVGGLDAVGMGGFSDAITTLDETIAEMDKTVAKGTMEKAFGAIGETLFGTVDSATKTSSAIAKAASAAGELQDNLKSKTELNAMTSKFNELINQAQQMNNALEEYGRTEAEIATVRVSRTEEALREVVSKLQNEKMLTEEMRKQVTIAYEQLSAYRDFNTLLLGTSETYGNTMKLAADFAKAAESGDADKISNSVRLLELAKEHNSVLIDQTTEQWLMAKSAAQSMALQQRLTSLYLDQSTLVKGLAQAEKEAAASRISAVMDAQIAVESMLGNTSVVAELEYTKQLESYKKMLSDQLISDEQYARAKAELEKKRDDKQTEAGLSTANKVVGAIGGGVSGIVNAIGAAFGPIGQFVAGIVNLLNKAPEEMKKFVNELISALNQLPMIVAKNIPIIIRAIVENLPDSIRSFLGTLSILLKEVVFNGAFWRDVVNGLIDAVVQGFSDIWAWLFEGADFTKLAENVSSSVGNALKSITGVGGELFSVENLTEGPVADAADAATKNLLSAGRTIKNWLGMAWEGMKKAGRWMDNNIWQPAWEGMKAAGRWLDDNLLQPLWGALRAIGQPIWDAIVSAFEFVVNMLKDAWEYMKSVFFSIISLFKGVFQGAWKMLKGIFTFDWGAIQAGFNKVLDTVWNTIKNIGSAMWNAIEGAFKNVGTFFANIGTIVWDSIKKAFSGATDFLKSIFSFDWLGDLWSKLFPKPSPSQGTVETWIAKIWPGFDIPFAKFAEGGFVPGTAKRQGNSYENDIIPALLSPGEFVLPRSITGNKDMMDKIMAVIGGQVEATYPGTVSDKVFADLSKRFGFSMHAGGLSWSDFDPTNASGALGQYTAPVLAPVVEPIKAVTESMLSGELVDLWNSLKKYIPSINFADLITNPFGTLTKAIEGSIGNFMPEIGKAFGFAEGGFVPRGTDTVPAMLTPGEFVLNRAAAQQLGEANLSLLNRGILPSMQSGGGGTTQNIEVQLTINTTNSVDPAMVKSRVMPVILEELRRASLDGRRVLAPNGVR